MLLKQVVLLSIALLSPSVVAQCGQRISSASNDDREKIKKTVEVPNAFEFPIHSDLGSSMFCLSKPVRRICGIIVNNSGLAASDTIVTLWKDKTLIKSTQVDETGKFDFDTQPGSYQLYVTAPLQSGSQIVQIAQDGWFLVNVSKPKKSCEKLIQIVMEPP